MATRDKGVRGDYIDRQMKSFEDQTKWGLRLMNPRQKDRFYAAKREAFQREAHKDLTEFEMVQESRPMLPPNRRKK